MKLVKDKISKKELKEMAESLFGSLVKGVVDVKREIMVVGGELHADGEAFLLKKGSCQKDLWGINIYPELSKDKMVEFDSMINVRPGQKNISRGIDDSKIRRKIIKIVSKLVE